MHATVHTDRRPSLTVDEYAHYVRSLAVPLETETRPVGAAVGTVFAESLVARFAIPPFDNSSMDGYALGGPVADGDTIHEVASITAGDDAANEPLTPGSAARVMTGAPIPAGTWAVVPIEDVHVDGSAVTVNHAPGPGVYIRAAGEDTRIGATLAPTGTLVTPGLAAAAAAVGHATVSVRPAPRVGVITTGSELTDLGVNLAPGHIPDSNAVYIAAALRAMGCRVTGTRRVADHVSDLREAIDALSTDADFIVTAGAISAGDHDIVRELLEPCSEFAFAKVAMQPGKPQGSGTWEGTPILCLPGNPVSVAVSLRVFGAELIGAFTRRRGDEKILRYPAGRPWRSPVGRRQFIPVTLEPEPDFPGPVAVPASPGHSRSHFITGLIRDDLKLAIVPEELDSVSLGENVEVIDLFS